MRVYTPHVYSACGSQRPEEGVRGPPDNYYRHTVTVHSVADHCIIQMLISQSTYLVSVKTRHHNAYAKNLLLDFVPYCLL